MCEADQPQDDDKNFVKKNESIKLPKCHELVFFFFFFKLRDIEIPYIK